MQIRNRITELRNVKASDLIPNPRNWRTHSSKQQNALRAVLSEIGYADALLARETEEGLQLIDGHCRAEISPDAEVPVLVLDLSQDEANKLLSVLDPIAAMAGANKDALEALLAEISFKSEELTNVLDSLASKNGIGLGLDDGQPNGAGLQTMSVLTGGTLHINGGTLKVGTVAVPSLPTGDGDYKLHIASGVATWVALT